MTVGVGAGNASLVGHFVAGADGHVISARLVLGLIDLFAASQRLIGGVGRLGRACGVRQDDRHRAVWNRFQTPLRGDPSRAALREVTSNARVVCLMPPQGITAMLMMITMIMIPGARVNRILSTPRAR